MTHHPRRRFDRRSLPPGREPGNPTGCQLGELRGPFCGRPMVTRVAKFRVCARHLRIIESIRRNPDPQASAVRHPETSVYLRVAP